MFTITPANTQFFTSPMLSTTERSKAHWSANWSDIDIMLDYWYGTILVNDVTQTVYRKYVHSWYLLNVDSLNRMYDAMVESYEPLENYTMYEVSSGAHKQAKLHNDNKFDDVPHTSANYTTTNDSYATGRLEGYNVTSPGYTTSFAQQEINNKTETYYENTDVTLATDDTDLGTAEGQVVDVAKHKRSGNIGVTTSQQMLDSEIQLRKTAFVNYFCEVFIRDMTSGTYDGGYDM